MEYSIEEIWEAIPTLKDNPLVQRVVEVFDEDQSGGVDFKEFVLGENYLFVTIKECMFTLRRLS